MAYKSVQPRQSGVWALAERQHGVVTRVQLLALGFSDQAILHRLRRGRLHRIYRGVYAVGRRELTRRGQWMAAVLSCGEGAALSHGSAAALWGMQTDRRGPIHITVPARSRPRRSGIVTHRHTTMQTDDFTTRHRIPVTTPVATLIALATFEPRERLEAAINEADKLGLVDPETLRAELDETRPRPGVRPLRETLDHRTFTLTDSHLERLFLPLARKAGLPQPLTQQVVNGFKVDFCWPGLGLVVETDGLRYHRTPAQQAKDRLRDQVHTAAGLTCLRFTRAQVSFDAPHVLRTLTAVAQRLLATA